MKRLKKLYKNYLQNFWKYLTSTGVNDSIHRAETELAAANKKLREQAIELKRLNEEMEQLAYTISHDLKAPVRNISGFMKLLLSRFANTFEGDAREFMQHSKVSAESLSKQIDDLLAYCRTGRNLPPASTVDLEQMIKTIRMEFSQKIAERHVRLIADTKLPVLAGVHAAMIYSVFESLIDNAIKFNTSKEIEVKINCREENGLFTFSITDNGIGINPSHSNNLFRMFNRLNNTEEFEGSGIGLAICKKIVNFYHGNIWFESEPGKGTAFFFTLGENAKEPGQLPPATAPDSGRVLKTA